MREILRREFEVELRQLLPEERIYCGEPMKEHTTFRVGGKAEYFLVPSTVEEIEALIRLCKTYQLPYLVMGNGSNLLVGDKGFDGVILRLGKEFGKIEVDGRTRRIKAQAGALLTKITQEAAEHSLSGLVFATGIPGSLGGAVAMNAGAYGGEISHVVESVQILTVDGEQKVFTKQEMNFGYRHSVVQEQSCIVLSVDFSLEDGDREELFSKMRELSARRKEKQPLEYASAGSTFKRPEGYFAGKLIMESGLSGYRVGGAQVSEKHCGFIVNTGGATAADVVAVMRHVQKTVMEKHGVMLEPEVRFAGRF